MKMIEYRITMESGRLFEFKVDPRQVPDTKADARPHPDWVRLGFHQCSNCPLPRGSCVYCPAALALENIITEFKDTLSYARAEVRVTSPERIYLKECDVQTALRSLVGLVMATSGCPILSQFRGLAASHLPFASLEETLFRTAGAYLVKQYFVHKSGGTPDLEMNGLDHFYKSISTVNTCFKSRVDIVCGQDANQNAVGSLFYVAVGIGYSLDDNLAELRGRFFPEM